MIGIGSWGLVVYRVKGWVLYGGDKERNLSVATVPQC